ncbi:MAG TPA: hypothetical protein VF943_12505 [Burkholderiales bacterium]
MKKSAVLFLVGFIALFGAGCSTTGQFRVPDNSILYVYDRSVEVRKDGKVRTRPFFWSAAGGIAYRLEKDGATVQEGKLDSKFRVASIFWPPFALIYWPMGFRTDVTYDLVTGPPGAGVVGTVFAPKTSPGDTASPKRP